MSSDNTRDVSLSLHAAREGDGYWASKGDQWSLLCPHMSSTAKIALGILCSLTGQTHPVRKLSAAELAGLLSKGPVAPGEAPKRMSASGAIRVLRELADLGQITRPDGSRLTISSRATVELSICVWRRPRHECGCARNVHDGLALLRGQGPWFPPASDGEPGQNSDQSPNPGENSDQPGENSDQPGQNSAKTPPLTCGDAPPFSLSSSSSSLSADPEVTPDPSTPVQTVTEERERGGDQDRASRHNPAPAAEVPEQRGQEQAVPSEAAVEFTAGLPGRLGRGTVSRLAVLVDAALLEGYTPETLRTELAERVKVPQIRSRSAVPVLYERALRDLPPAPATQASGPERCPDHPARYRDGCLDCALAVPA